MFEQFTQYLTGWQICQLPLSFEGSKLFSFRGASGFAPLIPAPGPRWGLRPQTPATTPHSKIPWPRHWRRGIVKDFVAQYCNLILYALRDPQPVKADECICCCLLILIDYWFLQQQQLSHFSHNSNLEVIVHLYPFPVPHQLGVFSISGLIIDQFDMKSEDYHYE